jgi:hypothetical protein
MHHRADTVDAFPRVLRFSIPDPPVQSLDLGRDRRLCGRARRITRRQSIANLFEMLKPHRDMEPVQNRRLQDASIGENTSESRTTIGEGRQRGVAGAANRIEVVSDQPFDVCPGLRDAAENLTAASFRCDIVNPHLKSTFSVLAAPYEGGIHADRDRRRRCRRPDRGTVSKRRASLQGMAAQGPGVDAGVDRKQVLQQISSHPVRYQSGQVCPEPVQFQCRAAIRRSIYACLDAAARGTAKPRQPQWHLSEQCRDRMVTIFFHPANPIAAGANRPPDRVLPRLRGGDLALNPREQLFRFREGQSQIGDIAEVIRLADLHDVHAGTLVPGYRQLQSPLQAPPPVQEQE